jgi:hypothetical protein
MPTFDRWIYRIIVLAFIVGCDFAAIQGIFFDFDIPRSLTFGSWVSLGMVILGTLGIIAFVEKDEEMSEGALNRFWTKTSLVCLYGFLSLSAILLVLGFV